MPSAISRRKYCSEACKNRGRAIIQRLVCKWCGVSFVAPPHGRPACCSAECRLQRKALLKRQRTELPFETQLTILQARLEQSRGACPGETADRGPDRN